MFKQKLYITIQLFFLAFIAISKFNIKANFAWNVLLCYHFSFHFENKIIVPKSKAFITIRIFLLPV